MSDWSVEVKDFQSIKDGKVEIPKGISIVTGDTNQGKTAILRAISAAIYNAGTDDLVRVGAKIAGVNISNDEHTMVYCRNSAGSSEKTAYQFDGGTVQRKVGRQQLPEVQKLFNIKDVRMKNDTKVRLNFWEQNDKPFLMDKTAGQLYEFISQSSADKYVKVLKRIKADLKVQKAEITNFNAQIDTLKVINNKKQDFVDSNNGYDTLYAKIITTDNNDKQLQRHMGIIQQIQLLEEQIQSINKQLNRVNILYHGVPYDEIYDRYKNLTLLNSDVDFINKKKQKVDTVSSNVQQCEVQRQKYSNLYQQSEESYNKLSGKIVEISDKHDTLTRLLSLRLDCLKRNSTIQSIQDKVENLSGKLVDTASLSSKVSTVVEKETQRGQIQSILNNVGICLTGKQKLTLAISGCDSKIQETSTQLEELKSSVGYCPFCGSVFEKGEQHTH